MFIRRNKVLIGIGDIHGDYRGLVSLLDSLDEEYRVFEDRDLSRRRLKVNPNVHLEFNGDFIDRGPESLKVLEYVKQLCVKNGNVSAKPGNHELLALQGLDEARQIVSGISDGSFNSKEAFDRYSNSTLHGVNGGLSFVRNFGDTPELAFKGFVDRMSKGGDLGQWIRRLAPYSIQETMNGKSVLFSHGDIPRDFFDEETLRNFEMNYFDYIIPSTNHVGGSVKKYDATDSIFSLFWNRNFSSLNGAAAVELADNLGVDYIVVGHTPQNNGILNIGNRVFNIDVGIYRGNDPAAIVFDKKGIMGHYVKGENERLLRYSEE